MMFGGVEVQEFIMDYLDRNQAYFKGNSEFIYRHPETRFEKYQSSSYLAKACKEQAFTVERKVANLETTLIATYGTGEPVSGSLGDFDALSELGQQPNETSYLPLGNVGHGCGHNLLGTGSFAAAWRGE